MDKSDSALILKCDKNQNNTTCDNPDDKTEQHIMIPSKPSKLITALSSLLPSNFLNLPPRWQNWFVRGQSGLLLISAFCSLISLGPLGLFGLTIVVQVNIDRYFGLTHLTNHQVSSFYELMQLGQKVTNVDDLSLWCWGLYGLGE